MSELPMAAVTQSLTWPTGGEHAGVLRATVSSIQLEATGNFESEFRREPVSGVLLSGRGGIATVTQDNTN